MAKPETNIPLPCGTCGRSGTVVREKVGIDPVTKKPDTTYHRVPCPTCGGKGFINK